METQALRQDLERVQQETMKLSYRLQASLSGAVLFLIVVINIYLQI